MEVARLEEQTKLLLAQLAIQMPGSPTGPRAVPGGSSDDIETASNISYDTVDASQFDSLMASRSRSSTATQGASASSSSSSSKPPLGASASSSSTTPSGSRTHSHHSRHRRSTSSSSSNSSSATPPGTRPKSSALFRSPKELFAALSNIDWGTPGRPSMDSTDTNHSSDSSHVSPPSTPDGGSSTRVRSTIRPQDRRMDPRSSSVTSTGRVQNTMSDVLKSKMPGLAASSVIPPGAAAGARSRAMPPPMGNTTTPPGTSSRRRTTLDRTTSHGSSSSSSSSTAKATSSSSAAASTSSSSTGASSTPSSGTGAGDVNPDEFQVSRVIGRGSSSKVYLATSPTRDTPFAIKKISLDGLSRDRRKVIRNVVALEVDFMKKVESPHVVRSLGYSYHSKAKEVHIVMEYVPHTLAHSIHPSGAWPEPVIATIIAQSVAGLKFLHSHSVIHRDFKPSNMLVTVDGVVKISDFGIATHVVEMETRKRSIVGTPYYVAPEVVQAEPYGYAADIWSLGCTLYELITGNKPLHHLKPMQALYQMAEGNLPEIPQTYGMSWACLTFLAECWKKNPKERPSAVQLEMHPFLTKAKDPPAGWVGKYLTPKPAAPKKSGSSRGKK